MTLSGGMKRRVMIAKALSHEPQILFLDEPTAGVDVELRRDMWELVRALRESGVTIILTTHYIEEAEEMADRIGVISKGELILVEDKAELMRKLGKKQLTLQLQQPLRARARRARRLRAGARRPTAASWSTPSTRRASAPASPRCCGDLGEAGIDFKDLQTSAELARGHLRQPGDGQTRHEPARDPRDLPLRDGAHLAHAAAEHRLAGDLDLALFRRVRRGDRLAHRRGRRRQLRRLHRARA